MIKAVTKTDLWCNDCRCSLEVTIGDLRKPKGYIGFNASGACDNLVLSSLWDTSELHVLNRKVKTKVN